MHLCTFGMALLQVRLTDCSVELCPRMILMERVIFSVIFLLSGLSSVCAYDPDRPVTIQRPFLWQFRRTDTQVTSYLFGTIHINDPNITRLHPKVQAAFDSSSAAWFEIDYEKDLHILEGL